MTTVTCNADAEGRICLPKCFANTKVIVEQVSESEVRVRMAEAIPDKAAAVPEEEYEFEEERPVKLTQRDQELIADLILNPPPLNDALRKAIQDFKREYE